MTAPPATRLPASLRRRSLARNVVVSWTAASLSALAALVMTPIVVRSLAQESYGVWSFLNGLMLYSNLLYVGLGTAFMRKLSEAVGHGDVAAQSRLASLAFTIYAGLGATCFTLTLIVGPFVPSMFAVPLPPETARDAPIAIALLGLRLALMFVNSSLSALLTAHGRLDVVGMLTMGTLVPRVVLLLWATSRPSPLVPLAMASIVDAALLLPALYAMCRVVTPAVRVRFTRPQKAELRSLYGFGVQVFAVQIAGMAIYYTDAVLIGMVLGAAAVGLYALPMQLAEQSRLLVSGVTQNLLPELGARRARGEIAPLASLLMVASRACATLSVFVNVHVVLLGPAFLTLWVGPAMAAESPRILLYLAVAATSASVSTQLMTPFYMAFDLVRVLVAVVIAEAVLNIALSYWLASTVGLWGVALGTAIPAVGLTLLFAPRPILARFEMSGARFAVHALGPATLLAIATISVQMLISRYAAVTSYLDLAWRVAASAAVALPIVLATFERHELPGPLRRFSLRRDPAR